MSKIYKGWELMKAIADGKIKNGTKIISKDCSNNRIICFNSNELYWKDNGESIFNSICLPDFLNENFELIEYEVDIDIDSIEEIKWTEINGTGDKQDEFVLEKNGRYICANYDDVEMELVRTVNKLIQAVKQIDKRVKELNTNEKS